MLTANHFVAMCCRCCVVCKVRSLDQTSLNNEIKYKITKGVIRNQVETVMFKTEAGKVGQRGT